MAASELELAQTAHTPAPDGTEAPALRIGRLYEQHYRMIRALCQLLLRDPVEAEDAAQQTFLSALASLIDGTDPHQPAPWLATIARRECWARTAQRRHRPLALDETNTPTSGAASPLEEAIRNADLTALWRAINDLPRQQRTAFLMREFSGLSYAQLAEALGASESAIESLLVRARRQLRDGLEATVSATNIVATPILLFQHRLARFLGERRGTAGAVTAAGLPVAAKTAAVVAGAIAVGSAGIGIGAGVLDRHATAHRASLDLSAHHFAPNALTDPSPLDRLIGMPATRLLPLAGSRSLQNSPADAISGGGGGNTGLTTASTSAATATPNGPAYPIAGGATPTITEGSTGPATSPNEHPSGTTDTPSTDTSPTGTTPTDTTPTDTTPTDTTPTDTTPTDTSPADTSPTDTTPAD